MFDNDKKEKIKAVKHTAIMIILQNILVTAMWIGLSLAFNKWWVGLFSLFTFQSVKYKFDDGGKDAD